MAKMNRFQSGYLCNHLEQLLKHSEAVFIHSLVMDHDPKLTGAGCCLKLHCQIVKALQLILLSSRMQVDIYRQKRQWHRSLWKGGGERQISRHPFEPSLE